MKFSKLIIFLVFTLSSGAESEIFLPEITVTSNELQNQKREPLVIQETSPGMKQPIIEGLQGDKILIEIDGIKFSNALFRSGPNQYYSWIPDEFVKTETTSTLLSSSLGGTVNRKLGIAETSASIKASTNTFKASAKYSSPSFQVGLSTIQNQNVSTPEDGEVQDSSYNQNSFYLGSVNTLGTTKFLLSQGTDIPRTDKFQKDQYYMYDLQRYILLKHTFYISDTTLTITPSWQLHEENIDRQSSKSLKSTNDMYGLDISGYHYDLFQMDSILKYGFSNTYEDIEVQKTSLKSYHYNTTSLWASYNARITRDLDYTAVVNYSYLDTSGSGLSRNMSGTAIGITFDYALDNSVIYASVNSNFKFPTIVNLAEARSDSVDEISNPNLRSEKAITYKIGYLTRNFDLVIFHKELEDMIQREQTQVPDGAGGYKYMYNNVDNGTIDGLSLQYNWTKDLWTFWTRVELTSGRTDYDYISKLQPVVTSTHLAYANAYLDFLYAPAVQEDKQAQQDKQDIRIKDHNYGYRILNLGYSFDALGGRFDTSITNLLNSRGRVYGSSVDFNERRLNIGYTWIF